MNNKVFVGNLDYSVTETELKDALLHAGVPVTFIRIVLDKETQRPRGFAFADVDCEPQEVIEKANGLQVGRRQIRIDLANTKRPAHDRPSRVPEVSYRDDRSSRRRREDEEVWREDRRRSRRA